MLALQVTYHLLNKKLTLMQQMRANKIEIVHKLQNIPVSTFPTAHKYRGHCISHYNICTCD